MEWIVCTLYTFYISFLGDDSAIPSFAIINTTFETTKGTILYWTVPLPVRLTLHLYALYRFCLDCINDIS